MHRRNLTIGAIYPTNKYGDVLILREVPPEESGNYCSTFYEIKFLNTGSTRIANGQTIQRGDVRDLFARTVCNIGYIGNISTKYPGTGKTAREYGIWDNMIHRCYNPKNHAYPTYGGAGVTVCERWHCYEYFYYDFTMMENYDNWLAEKGKWELDKDILQEGLPSYMKVYSPETCCIVPIKENVKESTFRRELNKEHNRDLPLGVYESVNTIAYPYIAIVMHNGNRIVLGRFNDPIAAAQYRDMYYKYILRDIQYANLNGYNDMTVGEVLSHWNRSRFLRTMCTVVDNSQPYMRDMCIVVDKSKPREMCRKVRKYK